MGLLLLMGNSGVSFTGALDSLSTGLESAWSVGRRLRTGYTGNIIRVRRSSDNTEQDFGYLASGAVDVAAVAAFCGVGDGFLTTIYDQSGLGRNLIQTSSVNQPSVVSSGVANTKNGKLTAVFNSQNMYVTPSQSLYNYLHNGTSSTICSVQEVLDTAVTKGFLSTYFSAGTIGTRINMSSTETVTVLVSPSVVQAPKTSAVLTYNAMTVLLDADNPVAADRESVWLDDSSVELTPSNALTAAPSTSNASTDLTVGFNWTQYFAGSICELIIWSQDISANRAVWQSTAKTFWGTP